MPQPVASKTEAAVEPTQTETKVEVINQEPYGPKLSAAPIPVRSEPPTKRTSKNEPVRRATSKSIAKESPSSNSGRNYSKEEVQALIVSYSEQHGISPEAPLCIAKHESGFNQHSKNNRSSASGVFQYLNDTWKATDEGKAGHSVFDAEANVKAAVKYMASRKNAQPWEVRGKCPQVKSK